MRVILDSMVWVEAGDVTPVEKSRLIAHLTVKPRGYRGEVVPPINLLLEVEEDTGDGVVVWYGMPVWYGLKFFQKKISGDMLEVMAGVEDQRAQGSAYEYEKFPTPRDDEQEVFFRELAQATESRPVVLAEAPTGSGKTVAGLNAIACIGKSALVICPTIKIAGQWRRDAIDPNILGLDPEDVGWIQNGKFDYVGKRITMAVIHNLTNDQRLPQGFEDAFGTVIWDEAHNLGARTFAKTMENIRARHRMALSAEAKRKDGCDNVFLHYFGGPYVKHTGQALPSKVRVFNYDWGMEFGAKLHSMPGFVKKRILAASKDRNALCAGKIVKMYEAGRNILVLGEVRVHLQTMIGLCSDLGVPDEDLGLYCRSYVGEDGKDKRISDQDLDYVAERCKIIFATYKMGKEGLDIERLDAGMDIYPRGDGVQSIGRIRRPVQGKPMPLWITIRDVGVKSFEDMTRTRLREYRNGNVEVIEHGKT